MPRYFRLSRRRLILPLALALVLSTGISATRLPVAKADERQWVSATEVLIASNRYDMKVGLLKTRKYSCPSDRPHLVNWKDDSRGKALTYTESGSGGNGTSADPDWFKVIHGGMFKVSYATKYRCSS